MLRSPVMNRLLRVSLFALAFSLAAPAARAADSAYPSDEALRHYLAGRWFEQSGDLASASAELSRALSLDPGSTTIQLEACLVASRLGEPQRALELARGVLEREPHQPKALWLEGAALVSLSRTRDALAPLRSAVAYDPDNTEGWRTLARVADQLDAVPLQDSCYERLVQLDEDDAENWFQLASVRAQQGRYAAADSALDEAVDLNPARPGMLFLRGWIREHLGRDDDAVKLYAHHLEIHPNDNATRRRLVGLLAELGRTKEGIAQARAVVKAEPDDPTVYQVLADLELHDHQPAEALRTLERMRALAPEDPGGIVRSTEVLARNDRDADAIRIADDWARAHAGDSHSLLLRAWVRDATGRPDSAIAYARAAVEAQPDSLAPRRMLARDLRLARRWDEAIAENQRLLAARPGDPGLIMDLGFCREQAGDLPGAIEAGRQALRVAPDTPSVLNFLGYMLADHDRDLGEAEQLIRRAVEQEPDNGAFVDSMGWLLFRMGRLDQARVQLERALALTGGDPVIHEHLGDVYRELRLFDLARQQYRESLAGDAGNVRVRGKLEAVR